MIKLSGIFAASSNPDSLGVKFRKRRFEFFKNKLSKLGTPLRILDVGGTEQYWINHGFHNDKGYHITLLNLEKSEVKHNNFTSIAGTATDLSQFSDKSFDLVHSNSVIEHLYNFDNQKLMASEVMRVGKYYYIQTPNRYFPVEPHYLFPFFQFLPKSVGLFILTKTKLSRMKKWNYTRASQYINEIRLMDKKEMLGLFNGCRLQSEKVAGLNKSFTAHNLPD